MVEQSSMTEYLFLVPAYAEPKDGEWTAYDGWQQASIDGKPLKTTTVEHFGGKMPLIRASEHIDYKSWEEHVKETINAVDD